MWLCHSHSLRFGSWIIVCAIFVESESGASNLRIREISREKKGYAEAPSHTCSRALF